MANTLPITIGGSPYEIAPMKFKQIKVAWAVMGKLAEMQANGPAPGTVEYLAAYGVQVDLAIQALSAAAIRTSPDLTVAFFDENLTKPEVDKVMGWFNALMQISGFEGPQDPASGEALPLDPPERSAATGTP